MTVLDSQALVRAASVTEVRASRRLVVHVDRHTICLFADGDEVYAVDNRCPHMGFPLHRGTVKDGILTCHWHHARFDLATGGTFDQLADDVRAFPVELRGDDVWIDLTPAPATRAPTSASGCTTGWSATSARACQGGDRAARRPIRPASTPSAAGSTSARATRRRLGPGADDAHLPHEPAAAARRGRPRRARSTTASPPSPRDSSGMAPRFRLAPAARCRAEPAPSSAGSASFIEVRDAEGAERCVVSAVARRRSPPRLADMLFAAVTDHRYIDIGHPLDFTNKALEALDLAAGSDAEACWPACAAATPAPSGWKNRTPGATRST